MERIKKARNLDMVENRFTVPVKYCFSHSKVQLNGEPLTNEELVRLLNVNDGAFIENFALKQENKELRILVDTLKNQNQKFKARLNDLGVEYY